MKAFKFRFCYTSIKEAFRVDFLEPDFCSLYAFLNFSYCNDFQDQITNYSREVPKTLKGQTLPR